MGVGGSTASCSIANAACTGVTCSNGYVLNTSDSNITCNSTCVFHSTTGTVIKLEIRLPVLHHVPIHLSEFNDMIIMREVPLHRILSYVHSGLNDGLCYYASWSCSATSRRFRCVYEGLQRVIGNLDGENIRHLEYISPKTPF